MPISNRFLINLRSDTAEDAVLEGLDPTGYLLAPNNATPTMRQLAAHVRGLDLDLMADNGNFTLLAEINRAHQGQAAVLSDRLEAVTTELGRDVRHARELPSALARDLRTLAREIQATARRTQESDEVVLAEQLSLDPTHLIGCEDLTMAAWLRHGLEPKYLLLRRRDYRRLNTAVAARAAEQLEGLPRTLRARTFSVASALDYDTAFDAGCAFAEAGVRRIAMGFGAYMADNSYSDTVRLHGRISDLPNRMPNRYLRTALATRGLVDGYQDSGVRLLGLHCLGLGAPIMIAVVAAIARAVPEVSYDATSPIRDAAEGTLYVTKPALLKVRARAVATRLATEETARWDCPCPFCTQFTAEHPFDYPRARRAWAGQGDRRAATEDLRPGGLLFEALPLFSEPSSGPLRTSINWTRANHNHWALHELSTHLTQQRTQRQLQGAVSDLIEGYSRHAGSQFFVSAVRFAFDLATADEPAVPRSP